MLSEEIAEGFDAFLQQKNFRPGGAEIAELLLLLSRARRANIENKLQLRDKFLALKAERRRLDHILLTTANVRYEIELMKLHVQKLKEANFSLERDVDIDRSLKEQYAGADLYDHDVLNEVLEKELKLRTDYKKEIDLREGKISASLKEYNEIFYEIDELNTKAGQLVDHSKSLRSHLMKYDDCFSLVNEAVINLPSPLYNIAIKSNQFINDTKNDSFFHILSVSCRSFIDERNANHYNFEILFTKKEQKCLIKFALKSGRVSVTLDLPKNLDVDANEFNSSVVNTDCLRHLECDMPPSKMLTNPLNMADNDGFLWVRFLSEAFDVNKAGLTHAEANFMFNINFIPKMIYRVYARLDLAAFLKNLQSKNYEQIKASYFDSFFSGKKTTFDKNVKFNQLENLLRSMQVSDIKAQGDKIVLSVDSEFRGNEFKAKATVPINYPFAEAEFGFDFAASFTEKFEFVVFEQMLRSSLRRVYSVRASESNKPSILLMKQLLVLQHSMKLIDEKFDLFAVSRQLAMVAEELF